MSKELQVPLSKENEYQKNMDSLILFPNQLVLISFLEIMISDEHTIDQDHIAVTSSGYGSSGSWP